MSLPIQIATWPRSAAFRRNGAKAGVIGARRRLSPSLSSGGGSCLAAGATDTRTAETSSPSAGCPWFCDLTIRSQNPGGRRLSRSLERLSRA